MKNTTTSNTSSLPMIVKYRHSLNVGVEPQTLTRHAIGYILKGRKSIYYGDTCYDVHQGEVFYLSIGVHYIEDHPDSKHPFEQIIFYFSTEDFSNTLSHLTKSYSMEITADMNWNENPLRTHHHAVHTSWRAMDNFFTNVNSCIKAKLFCDDNTAEKIKRSELIYLIFSKDDCSIRGKILESVDQKIENFEKIINDHIFVDISIEDLADLCNQSTTAFKREFKRRFQTSPHQWFIKQRLMYSRLLLMSTSKSVSEIGIICNFQNSSHFIKLFKKEYSFTPFVYRNTYRQPQNNIPKYQQTIENAIQTNI